MSVFFLCTGLQGKNIYTSIKLLSAQRKKERKKEGKKEKREKKRGKRYLPHLRLFPKEG